MVSDEIIEGKIFLALIILMILMMVMFFVLFILLGLVQGGAMNKEEWSIAKLADMLQDTAKGW